MLSSRNEYPQNESNHLFDVSITMKRIFRLSLKPRKMSDFTKQFYDLGRPPLQFCRFLEHTLAHSTTAHPATHRRIKAEPEFYWFPGQSSTTFESTHESEWVHLVELWVEKPCSDWLKITQKYAYLWKGIVTSSNKLISIASVVTK